MISIIRTQPSSVAVSTFLDATVSLRDGNAMVEGCPDIVFQIRTYQKIASREVDAHDVPIGDKVLLPANLFFQEFNLQEQIELYNMYANTRKMIAAINLDNRRELQDAIQMEIFQTAQRLDLVQRAIDFCRGPRFVYPNLQMAGTEPHHTKDKTFSEWEYPELTAIAVLAKLLVPIWGEFFARTGDIGTRYVFQREQFSFDLLEPTLEESALERIYNKLYNSLRSTVKDLRAGIDKKPLVTATTSFIITHNGTDDEMLEAMTMATIVVKRLATFDCFSLQREGNPPNIMVYIDDAIRKSIDSRISNMRETMKTLPKRELSDSERVDNISIIDHISRTSSKSIDVPIVVSTAVKHWELDKLLKDTDTPLDVYEAAVHYYSTNPFDISPLTQAMVSSFIGTRFGGSKCLNYLTSDLYQRVVVILQIFLLRNNLVDLAALLSSITSTALIEGVDSVLAMQIKSNYETKEYAQCKSLFVGYLEKPAIQIGKRQSRKRGIDMERIDFVNHISRIIEWLIRHNHAENMAPALWDLSNREVRPIVGSDCQFDKSIVQQLCYFYLIFHDPKPAISEGGWAKP